MMSITSELARLAPDYTSSLDEDNWMHFERLLQLHNLVSVVTETNLNKHLIVGHLDSPPSMKAFGYLYDSQLAAYLGMSLQETADTTAEVLDAIDKGTFGDTQTFARIAPSYRYMSRGGIGIPSPDLVVARADQDYGYTQRLAAEIVTLGALGVASVDPVVSTLAPIATDSFFEEFAIIPQS